MKVSYSKQKQKQTKQKEKSPLEGLCVSPATTACEQSQPRAGAPAFRQSSWDHPISPAAVFFGPDMREREREKKKSVKDVFHVQAPVSASILSSGFQFSSYLEGADSDEAIHKII